MSEPARAFEPDNSAQIGCKKSNSRKVCGNFPPSLPLRPGANTDQIH